MKTRIRVHKVTGAHFSNENQTLPERIRYLRSVQKPFMTQLQLAYLARVSKDTISQIENSNNVEDLDFKLSTLRKIANGLGGQIYINIKLTPSLGKGECLPLENGLPPPPELHRKRTAQGLRRAAEYGNYPGKRTVLRRHRELQKLTSGKPDLASEKPKVE